MRGPAGNWIELNLCGADQSTLLVRCVAPLLRHLRSHDGIGRTYFLRKDGGVHVRVELRDAGAATVMRMLDEVIACEAGLGTVGANMDKRPTFDELAGLWSGPAAADLRDDFFSQTANFTLECLTRQQCGAPARMQLAFDLMVANAVALDEIVSGASADGRPRAFLSYRSHADGFFIMSREPDATKRLFDERCRKLQAWSANRLSTILAALQVCEPRQWSAAVWRANVMHWFPLILTLLRERRLELPRGEDAYLGDYRDISISSFHGVIQNDLDYRRQMREDVNFHCVRVLLSLLYWTLHNLGVRLIERFFLCHLTSLAFERRFGVDPTEALVRV